MGQLSSNKIIGFIVFISLIALPFLFRLDYVVIQPWDESLFAFRAYHLNEYGSPLKTLNDYSTTLDFANTKPIFMTFWQAVSYRVFGYTEFALRFPIAITSIILCLVLVPLCNKSITNKTTGWVAALILCSSLGMVYFHLGRSGNQDIPFSLFAFLFAFHSYKFIETLSLKRLIYASIFFGMAYFTKSVFIGITFPAILITFFLHPNFRKVIRSGGFWIFAVVLVGIVLAGFMDGTPHFGNYQRLTQVIEHKHPFYYYLKQLTVNWHFMPWFLIIPFGIGRAWKKPFTRYIFLQAICILVIISISQTKLYWYSAPLYPYLAILAAFTLANWISKWTQEKQKKRLLVYALILVGPYILNWYWLFEPIEYKPANKVIVVLKKAEKEQPDIKSFTIFAEEQETPQIDFYQRIYNYHKGFNNKRIYSLDEDHGKFLIAQKHEIEKHFKRESYQILIDYHYCFLIEFID